MAASASDLSDDWLRAPRIYVENARERDPAYHATGAMLREIIAAETGGRVKPAEVTVAFADERDIAAWERAHILFAGRLDTRAIPRMRDLRLLQCTSAGVESYVPLDWLPDGVELYNASGVHAEKIAGFGAMAVLMLHEHVPLRTGAQARHEWLRTLRPAPRGARVTVFGAGALGQAVACALAPFGFAVTGIGRHPDGPRPGFQRLYGPDMLESLLPETDILVLAAPLTEETRKRIGRCELLLLPKGAGVLNIARAAIMDYDALADLLEAGHLAGAILDVFDREPLPADARWWDTPNLMVFPHVSADDPTNYQRGCMTILGGNLAALMDGRPTRNRVDTALGY